MTLVERHVLANDVRVPAVERGHVVVVGRYGHEQPKAVVMNPGDYLHLRETAELVADAWALTEGLSAAALEARELEDRPRDDRLVEDSRTLAELLGL